jgi:hypothetical protein
VGRGHDRGIDRHIPDAKLCAKARQAATHRSAEAQKCRHAPIVHQIPKTGSVGCPLFTNAPTDTFDIVVSSGNDPPTVAHAIADQSANEDAAFSFQFASNVFDDDDADPLTYTATKGDGTALPAWISFNAATRTFSGTPAVGDVGTLTVMVTADDGHGGTVADTFDIVLTAVNDAPTVANVIADQTTNEGDPFSFQFNTNVFADEENDPILLANPDFGSNRLMVKV